MAVFKFKTHSPEIESSAWIAHDANIIGKVKILKKASVWFGATLRGDNEEILLGQGSNIQENCVLHTDHGFLWKLVKTVQLDTALSCMAALLQTVHSSAWDLRSLTELKIGTGCLIGAGSLITENKVIPDGSLVMGSPGKVIRHLDDEAKESLISSALHYQERAAEFSKT